MITAPTMPQLLATLRDELESTVMPQVDDAPTKVAIEMMQAVLNQLIERAENEFAWMFGEMAAIEAAAGELGPSLGSADVDAALAEFRANRADTMTLSAVTADYQRASEVLSRLGEAAYASGDAAAIDTVQGLIDARLATENAAIGEFIAVGRD